MERIVKDGTFRGLKATIPINLPVLNTSVFSPQEGLITLDSATKTPWYSNGTIWQPISTGGGSSPVIATVTPSMTTPQIQAVLDDVTYNTVMFVPGIYTLTDVLIVRRNNLDLDVNFATLVLGNAVYKPCIFIGDITSITPVNVYNNITVRNAIINGNKAGNPASETDPTRPWIYNNGITISQCTHVTISQCTAFDCRSGGIVWTVFCNNLTITECECYTNFFDGIAGYTSENVRLENSRSHDHSNGAGLSMDNDGSKVSVKNCSFTNNDVGIFARWTSEFVFTGNTITDSIGNGMFLSGYNAPVDNSCYDGVINGNIVSNNGGQGIWLQGCQRVSVSNNTIRANNTNGINVTNYGPGNTFGVSKYLSISSNLLLSNLDVGIFSDGNNSTANGAVGNYFTTNVVFLNTNAQVVLGDPTAWTVI